MNANELKTIFNKVIAENNNPDTIANLELCREYFTNPEFKKYLEETTFSANK